MNSNSSFSEKVKKEHLEIINFEENQKKFQKILGSLPFEVSNLRKLSTHWDGEVVVSYSIEESEFSAKLDFSIEKFVVPISIPKDWDYEESYPHHNHKYREIPLSEFPYIIQAICRSLPDWSTCSYEHTDHSWGLEEDDFITHNIYRYKEFQGILVFLKFETII